jgi:S-adenosylmethionine/arginine decarboxylase-like enzyme
MHHFIIDGFRGFRSRMDDVRLVQELLEEIPARVGTQPVMPAFLIPYYNGVRPEDCGISAFVFLKGGHFTLHTFSFRETYFADLLYPAPFDIEALQDTLGAALPCELVNAYAYSAVEERQRDERIDRGMDFGPHIVIGIEDYAGPDTLDDLFDVAENLPANISMTPIMRPYVIKNRTPAGEDCLSAMVMIAESHISLHIYPGQRRAYFDLFSCSFFDEDKVIPKVLSILPGGTHNIWRTSRGKGYAQLATTVELETERKTRWFSQ